MINVEMKHLIDDTVDEQRRDIENMNDLSVSQRIEMTTIVEIINDCEDLETLNNLYTTWVEFTIQFDD